MCCRLFLHGPLNAIIYKDIVLSDIWEPESKVVVTSMGHYHPENHIESSFFETLDIGSSTEWILERTGIKSRRSVLSKEDIALLRRGATSLSKLISEGKVMSIPALSKPAWNSLIKRLGRSEVDEPLDAIICGTSVPDYDIPANACAIGAMIDASCPSFDVNSACSSFVVNLQVSLGLLRSSLYKRIAIFNPERYSLRMDYTDRKSCILFGDGCAASLVEATTEGSGLEVLDVVVFSDPKNYDVVSLPDGQCFRQDGKVVQKFAISKTMQSTQSILERNNLTPGDVSFFIGHQANLRMVESAARRIGIPPEKHLYNVDQFGNQGAAGAPSVLSSNWNRFQTGDYIVVTVVGSGLTWGSALLRKI